MSEPTEPFVTLFIIRDKMAEEWREIFEERKKEGGSFKNNGESQCCFHSICI